MDCIHQNKPVPCSRGHVDVVLSTAVSHGGRDKDGCEKKGDLKITAPLKGGARGSVCVTLGHHLHKFPAKAASVTDRAGVYGGEIVSQRPPSSAIFKDFGPQQTRRTAH